MTKLFLLLPLFVLFSGCTTSEFTEDESVTKYALGKYEETLKKNNVKFLKCVPTKDEKMIVTYTTEARDNSFPSTIRFDYLNQSYNVYFDKAYLNNPKNRLLKDIDDCLEAYKKLKSAKDTWK